MIQDDNGDEVDRRLDRGSGGREFLQVRSRRGEGKALR